MYERFEGALEHAYKGKSGSIYKLSADGFMEESAISSGELVSEEETDVIEEIEVEDALEYLENLEAEGKLRIYRYPEIPEGFPKDKSDIVEKAVQWTIDFGEHILDEVEKYHPDVLERVLNDLKYRGYKVKGEYNI